jgi:hypothetical protein
MGMGQGFAWGAQRRGLYAPSGGNDCVHRVVTSRRQESVADSSSRLQAAGGNGRSALEPAIRPLAEHDFESELASRLGVPFDEESHARQIASQGSRSEIGDAALSARRIRRPIQESQSRSRDVAPRGVAARGEIVGPSCFGLLCQREAVTAESAVEERVGWRRARAADAVCEIQRPDEQLRLGIAIGAAQARCREIAQVRCIL